MVIQKLLAAFLFAGVICNVTTVRSLFAECPCNKGRAQSLALSAPSYGVGGGYVGNAFSAGNAYSDYGATAGNWAGAGSSDFSGGYSTGFTSNQRDLYFSAGYPGVGPGYSGATATTWQPPSGTLGRTYQIKSRPIPVSMHPRSAIVDVRARGAKRVVVHEMNQFRTEDYLTGFQDHLKPEFWHFTTEPMIPGLPHIYRVEAHFENPQDLDGDDLIEERYVRLIMGRVIELDFHEVR